MMVWRWGCERKKKIKDNSKTFDLRYWKDGVELMEKGKAAEGLQQKSQEFGFGQVEFEMTSGHASGEVKEAVNMSVWGSEERPGAEC